MAPTSTARSIASLEDLEALYGPPVPRSLTKELGALSAHYRAFVEAAPFVVVASVGPEGLDCSPRGDPPGFVRVLDEHTVLMPDRRGNNRLDTLKNLVRDPRISLLFLIPGVGETLRINGRADIIVDPALAETFSMQGKAPTTIIKVSIESVYFQCQKALARSNLWSPDALVVRSSLPTAGEMAQATSPEPFDGKAYDAGYPEHIKKTIY